MRRGTRVRDSPVPFLAPLEARLIAATGLQASRTSSRATSLSASPTLRRASRPSSTSPSSTSPTTPSSREPLCSFSRSMTHPALTDSQWAARTQRRALLPARPAPVWPLLAHPPQAGAGPARDGPAGGRGCECQRGEGGQDEAEHGRDRRGALDALLSDSPAKHH